MSGAAVPREAPAAARLDDPAALRRADPGGMLDLVASAGRQARDALDAAAAADLRGPLPSTVVVAGMGGSGIAGDVLAALAAPAATVPVLTVKHDRLPRFVRAGTLVIALSYSGNTDETVAAAQQALQVGARLVAVTSGGRLAELAHAAGAPVVGLPAGMPPRAALWSLTVPVLAVAEAAGVLPAALAHVPAAADVLDAEAAALGPDVPGETNPAKQAAARLAGTLPVVWGTGLLGAVAATRFRCQCNENAKISAVSAAVPEADHNDVMGLEGGPGPGRTLVLLRDLPGEHPRDAVRVDAVLSALGLSGPAAPLRRDAGDGPDLVRFARLVAFADYTSVYLGLARGVDPTAVRTIDHVKELVAAGSRA